MKFQFLTTGMVLAAAGLLTACGGGHSSPAATEQKTGSTTAQAAAMDLATHSLAADTSVLNSSDAHVLTAESASKSAAVTPVIVKSVPVVPRNMPAQAQTVDLGAVPAAELSKREANNRRSATAAFAKAYQTGIGRTIAATSQAKSFQQLLNWSPLSTGNTAGTARFSSADAYGIRLGLLITQLPDNALVRVSGTDSATALEITGAAINQAIAANVAADGDTANARTYWLPLTVGTTADLVIELPSSVSSDGITVSVPSLIHVLESTPQASLKEASLKTACPDLNPDPVCNATLPPAANAVSTYDFVQNGEGYLCTGTLLADKAASNQPYFLTANHCVGSQTVASSLINYWFYRSTACNNNTTVPYSPTETSGYQITYGGAALLWNRSDSTSNTRNPIGTDTSFLRLNAPPPVGVMFAGWTISRQPISNSVALTGLHHPGGAVLRQSTGTISNMGVYLSNGSLISTADTSQPMYQTSWSSGITEGGSSGSGLFLNGTTANPQVVGQLWGGYSSCSAPTAPDFYGRFDLAYQNGLINWLNPGYRMVFRFYRPTNGTHFFTATVDERDATRANIPSLGYEAPVFMVSPSAGAGLYPVYRFYNKQTGVHFYTMSEEEKTTQQANTAVFTFEGIGWYARQAGAADPTTVPVYRFFRTSAGTHFYTASVDERNYIIANLGQYYAYEGEAYRAWPIN